MNTALNVKNDIKDILDRMNFHLLHPPEVRNRDERILVNVFVDDPKLLIGERGVNLSSFQHVVRLIVNKKYGPDVKVDVDVNGYKKKRAEFLQDMALSARRRALEKGKSFELEPMNSFDRRVIHATLTEYNDVETQSVGENPQRRVVVNLV